MAPFQAGAFSWGFMKRYVRNSAPALHRLKLWSGNLLYSHQRLAYRRFSSSIIEAKRPCSLTQSRPHQIPSIQNLTQSSSTYHQPERPLLPPISQRSARALALARIQETENLHNAYDVLEDAHFETEKAGKHLEIEQRSALVTNVSAELDYWEVYASRSAYIAGDEFGLADCAFFPLLAYMVHRGFDRRREDDEGNEGQDDWPHLRAYFERVWERGGESGCATGAACW
ncbi:hypothetical protein B0H11DRAFT_1959102, partial [Mycena galericulata]